MRDTLPLYSYVNDTNSEPNGNRKTTIGRNFIQPVVAQPLQLTLQQATYSSLTSQSWNQRKSPTRRTAGRSARFS